MSETTYYVYIICSTDGSPLYVGCGRSVGLRVAAHQIKPWYGDAASVTFERYQGKAAAFRAEAETIARLRPPHNVPVPRPVSAAAPTWQLLSMATGGNAEGYLARSREAGMTYQGIADALARDFSIRVSREWIRLRLAEQAEAVA